MKILLTTAATALVAAALAPAQVRLNHLTTVDLDPTSVATNPEYIGSNPGAIAWNGIDLLVAGYNNDSPNNPPATIGIVRISNVLNTPSFGAAFGQISTPGFRGYSGLDTDGANLVAAYDDGGANAQGIALYDANDNLVWSKTARGGSGVGFDPGIPGGSAQGRGVAWTTFGSGRRALQDSATGNDIWTTSSGMIIDAGVGFFWRDMDFDDQTGDIWLREGNNVIRGVRNGDNSLSSRLLVVDALEADFINVQNLAVIRQSTGGVVIYNDRASNQSPQAFEDVIRAVRFDGTPEPIAYGSFPIPPSTNINGAFDFSYEPFSRTLAILDFANRDCHIFQVDILPYYDYGQACQSSMGGTPELTLGGTAAAGTTLTYTIDGGPANGTGFVVFGALQGHLPIGNGCAILVDPLLDVFLGPLSLNGTGSGRTSLALPRGTSGAQLTQQGAIIDLGLSGPFQIVTTEGVLMVVQ